MSTGLQSRSGAVIAVLLILLIGGSAALAGCRKKRTPEEQLTVERVAPMCRWLEDYKRGQFCYPDTWDQLLRWKGKTMPENPYTGEPMICVESSEFDPETSPGNIYYVRVIQDDCVINCQVIIFGERGEITRYSHAGPLAPK